MLKVRLIPTLLWKDYGLVKGIAFDSWRRVGPALPSIKVYNSRDVDELLLVDITATAENSMPDAESVREFAEECYVPLTVGGGISEIGQVQTLLFSGADKIAINSSAYDTPELVEDVAKRFGSQAVVVSIDAKCVLPNTHECFSHAGTMGRAKKPVEWAREVVDRGAGEILLTSIDRDGTMTGYDLELLESVASAVSIPVIASGGAGNYQHMIDAVVNTGVSAVAAASIFHFTELTPAGAKQAMAEAGIAVRHSYSSTAA